MYGLTLKSFLVLVFMINLSIVQASEKNNKDPFLAVNSEFTRLLNSTSPLDRKQVVLELGELEAGNDFVVSSLIRSLSDNEEQIRFQAAASLIKLGKGVSKQLVAEIGNFKFLQGDFSFSNGNGGYDSRYTSVSDLSFMILKEVKVDIETLIEAYKKLAPSTIKARRYPQILSKELREEFVGEYLKNDESFFGKGFYHEERQSSNRYPSPASRLLLLFEFVEPTITNKVIGILSDNDIELVLAAIKFIIRSESNGFDVLQGLKAVILRGNPELSYAAAYALSKLGQKGHKYLINLFSNHHPVVRANSLYFISPNTFNYAELIETGLKDDDVIVRAIANLRIADPDASSILGFHIGLYRAQSACRAEPAAIWLNELNHDEVIRILANSLMDSDKLVSNTAIKAIASLSCISSEFGSSGLELILNANLYSDKSKSRIAIQNIVELNTHEEVSDYYHKRLAANKNYKALSLIRGRPGHDIDEVKALQLKREIKLRQLITNLEKVYRKNDLKHVLQKNVTRLLRIYQQSIDNRGGALLGLLMEMEIPQEHRKLWIDLLIDDLRRGSNTQKIFDYLTALSDGSYSIKNWEGEIDIRLSKTSTLELLDDFKQPFTADLDIFEEDSWILFEIVKLLFEKDNLLYKNQLSRLKNSPNEEISERAKKLLRPTNDEAKGVLACDSVDSCANREIQKSFESLFPKDPKETENARKILDLIERHDGKSYSFSELGYPDSSELVNKLVSESPEFEATIAEWAVNPPTPELQIYLLSAVSLLSEKKQVPVVLKNAFRRGNNEVKLSVISIWTDLKLQDLEFISIVLLQFSAEVRLGVLDLMSFMNVPLELKNAILFELVRELNITMFRSGTYSYRKSSYERLAWEQVFSNDVKILVPFLVQYINEGHHIGKYYLVDLIKKKGIGDLTLFSALKNRFNNLEVSEQEELFELFKENGKQDLLIELLVMQMNHPVYERRVTAARIIYGENDDLWSHDGATVRVLLEVSIHGRISGFLNSAMNILYPNGNSKYSSRLGELNEFPWPPPSGYKRSLLPKELFAGESNLGGVYEMLSSSIESVGSDHGLFGVKEDGFALVTRMERVNRDGFSSSGQDRWVVSRSPKVDLIGFLGDLYFEDPGHFRVIVFIVTSDISFKSNPTEVLPGFERGAFTISSSLSKKQFSEQNVLALIYTFKRLKNAEVTAWLDDGLTAKQHIVKAGMKLQ